MNTKRRFFYFGTCVLLCVLLGACDLLLRDLKNDGEEDGDGKSTVTVSPAAVTMAKGTTQQFSARMSDSSSAWFTWSIEGDHVPETTISREGLLSVAANETARTFTVKAKESYDDGIGTAVVTVATDAEIPSNLKITQPGKTGLSLSWSAVNNAEKYKIYRSGNGKDYSYLGEAAAGAYQDTAVVAGVSYYYAVSAVVNGLETGKSVPAFGFAEAYFALPVFAERRLLASKAGEKHYYRFPVTSGGSYTITWEDGYSKDAYYGYLRASAWQHDGASIFSDGTNGYTSPKVFTASATGYVTVEVKNIQSSGRYSYMAYCLLKNNEPDAGVVALPPAQPRGLKVSGSDTSSISLSWEPVEGAVKYNVYRFPTPDSTPGLLSSTTSPEFTDTSLSSGASFYYTLAAENADGREGSWGTTAFGFAALHYGLETYSGSRLLNISAGAKHYYRFAVTAGQSYTITLQDGNNNDVYYGYLRASAWQNDGTSLFSDSSNGYTSPKVFAASVTGYVTVEVKNIQSSGSCDYQIYR
jgi:hypothetical protein